MLKRGQFSSTLSLSTFLPISDFLSLALSALLPTLPFDDESFCSSEGQNDRSCVFCVAERLTWSALRRAGGGCGGRAAVESEWAGLAVCLVGGWGLIHSRVAKVVVRQE